VSRSVKKGPYISKHLYKKIVDMGAGVAIDGRNVTIGMLEQKIAETLLVRPLPFRAVHTVINGRKNAAEIILAIAERRQS